MNMTLAFTQHQDRECMEKWELSFFKKVKFLDDIISNEGVKSDSIKTATLVMHEPTNVNEINNFLRIANQLRKFIP